MFPFGVRTLEQPRTYVLRLHIRRTKLSVFSLSPD